MIGVDETIFENGLNNLKGLKDSFLQTAQAEVDAFSWDVNEAEAKGDALVSELGVEINRQVAEAKTKTQDVKARTDAELNAMLGRVEDVKLKAEVKLNSIYALAQQTQSVVFQTLEIAGVVIDASLKGVIQTAFATAQFLLSMKAAAAVEGPTGWARMVLLVASYALTIAAAIKAENDRMRISSELHRTTSTVTVKFQSVRGSVKL